MSLFGVKFKLLYVGVRWWFVLLGLRVKESLGVVQGPGNWKVVSVKKKDRSFAAVESGLQWATYPQSPDSGPGPLLRRSEPVPGILAAARSGAIVDKSEWISLSAVVLATFVVVQGTVQSVSVC